MTEVLYNEEELRAFLLGDLTESERVRIEERFLGEEDFAVQVHVVEDELIESYLRDDLSPADRQKFSGAFLAQPRRRERVLAMKAVLAVADEEAARKNEESPSFWASLSAFFSLKNAAFSYAVVAAILIALFLGGRLLFSRFAQRQSPQLAQKANPIQVPLPALASPSETPNALHGSPSPALSPVPRPTPSPITEASPAGPTVATIILRPTLVRDPSAANRLLVSSSVQTVHLQLKLEHNDYRVYSVRITTVEGRLVWQRGSMKVTGTALYLNLSGRLVTTGDYLVEVSGISDAGSPESVASYFFSVRQK